jgi:hypothetical protein
MQPITRAMAGALNQLLRGTPMSPGKMEFAWGAAVGSALQRATEVRLEGEVLLVEAATEQWAHELSRSADIILSRLQSLLGEATVRRIVIRSVPRPERRSGS